jgi:hypothetical protein
MGAFYGSIHVRTNERGYVQTAVEQIAKQHKLRFLIGPVLNGWVSVYPQNNGQDGSVAKDLAKRLRGYILDVMVHDDDVFAYSYYQEGKLADSFDSRPDYFAPVSKRVKAKLVGKPALLQPLLPQGKSVDDLAEILSIKSIDDTVMASDLLERFC